MPKPGRMTLLTGWCLVILVLTLIPGNKLPDLEKIHLLTSIDLWVHGSLFLVFSILFMRAFTRKLPDLSFSKVVLRAIFSGIVFGSLTEFLQLVIPVNRNASLFDLMADVFGLTAGLAIFSITLAFENKRS
jgi:VanZ family protein